MENKEPRKRIKYEKKGLPAIEDKLEFVKNKCSDHAREVFTEIEKNHFSVWFDKHYHDRHQLGDESGKRENIDPLTVENLIRKSIRHLSCYSSIVKGFIFINYKIGNESPIRVVLQEELNGSILNVIIEAHYLGLNSFQITVKTAMCVDDFRLGQGQYLLEFQGDESFLKKYDNRKVIDVCNI
jgi:hypothetical protein